MALTLDRPHTRPRRRLSLRGLVAAGTGPLGVLAAAGLLTVGFLAAVANLVTRLG